MSGSGIPIAQSGSITPGHAVVWTTDGVVQDAGPATAGGLSEIGITADGGISLGINSGVATGPYVEYGIGVSHTGTVTVYVDSFGGAPDATLYYNINGVTYPFNPSGGGNITGPGSSVSGDVVTFNGTGGNIVEDSGILAANIVQGPTAAASGDIALFNGVTGKLIKDGGFNVATAIAFLGGAATVANVTALRAYDISPPALVIAMEGYTDSGDLGAGLFAYVSTDTSSADNGGTIIVDAASHRWYRITNGGPLNAAWFGASPTSTDCTAALNAALAVLATPGGEILFPAGEYTFLSPVTYTLPAGQLSVSVAGVGADATILYWPTGSGLTFAASSAVHSVHVRDLTIATGVAGSGGTVGCALTNSIQGGTLAQNDFTRVTFRGIDGGNATDYWGTGLQIVGNGLVNYVGCLFYGPSAANVGNGVSLAGNASGVFQYSIVHNFYGCSFFYTGSGVVYGTYVQGVALTSCNFTNGQTGIYLPADAVGAAQLTVVACQFECTGNCIDLAGPLPGLEVSASLFFIAANYAGIGSDGTLIQAAVTGNTFNGNNTTTGNSGVFLDQSGAANVISGNAFYGLNQGIGLGPDSTNCNVQSNAYYDCSTDVVNAGTDNTIGGGSS